MKAKPFLKEGIPTVKITSPDELQDFRLIDVRTPEEFTGELGHIEGSELVTLGPELEDFLNKANKEESILLICRSSARSGRATEAAMQMGFKKVYNMEGGMLYWNEMKLPIKKI